MDSLERPVDIGAGLEARARPRGSSGGRSSGRDRSRGRSRRARDRSGCGPRTWRAGGRGRVGVRARGAHVGEREVEDVADGALDALELLVDRRRVCARAGSVDRLARAAEGAPDELDARDLADIDANAVTRVSAPSSRRRFSGAASGDLLKHLEIGDREPVLAGQPARSAILVAGSGPWTSTVRPQAKRSRIRSLSRSIASGGRSLESTIWLPGVELVERVEELVLGPRLALEELDVVDQQRVDAAIALLEALGGAPPSPRSDIDELGGEPLGCRVDDVEVGALPGAGSWRSRRAGASCRARGAVEEQRVVGLARGLGDGERGRVGEAVSRTDHELIEVESVGEPGGNRGPRPGRPRTVAAVGCEPGGSAKAISVNPGARRAQGVGGGGAVAALEPVADPVGPGDVEAAPLDPDRPQWLEPVLERGRRQRARGAPRGLPPDRRSGLGWVASARCRGRGSRRGARRGLARRS